MKKMTRSLGLQFGLLESGELSSSLTLKKLVIKVWSCGTSKNLRNNKNLVYNLIKKKKKLVGNIDIKLQTYIYI